MTITLVKCGTYPKNHWLETLLETGKQISSFEHIHLHSAYIIRDWCRCRNSGSDCPIIRPDFMPGDVNSRSKSAVWLTFPRLEIGCFLNLGFMKIPRILRPVHTTNFKDPIIGSENWKKALRRSDFKVSFLWWEYWMVIFNVFTRSDFRNQ